ncbi:MAG: hypothetical protein M1830_004302 [Pleopsidium flavum]|nr:MAG: hypothetical protein M1830_004302 [Pleopsidium flavum]
MSERSHHHSRRRDDLELSLHSPSAPHNRASHRHRSRSPHGHHHKRKRSASPKPLALPFNAQKLSKHDLELYRPMFALYLDIQKQLVLEDLDPDEVKGRWKSFVGKWNRGELAEGWYDPSTRQKASDTSTASKARQETNNHGRRGSPDYTPSSHQHARRDNESSDDDVLGPTLPNKESGGGGRARRAGPAIPNMQDLELQRELAAEDNLTLREEIRHARKLDRTQQAALLAELVPPTDAGTRERQLERKRELTSTLRSFARAKSPGAVEEVLEGELMGDDDGGIEGYKKLKREGERKKNERELRKEEMLRARAAEREERVAEYRVKEDKTMDMLKSLARQNFG